jgi:hypothetical protein
MTTTLIARSLFGRARTQTPGFTAVAYVCASAHDAPPAHGMFPAAAATPSTGAVPTTNPWLGGDVQGSGDGSTSATKRIAPGRLEGMT